MPKDHNKNAFITISQLLFQKFKNRMGVCSPRISGLQYHFGNSNHFLICQRDPLPSIKKLEIHFVFYDSISTIHSTSQEIPQTTQTNRYDIQIKRQKSKIETTLDEIGMEILNAFKKAFKLKCTKIEFVEPSFQPESTVSFLFNQILRMLLYFDQKQMFREQRKIYLNWTAIDKKAHIANILKWIDI